jgi:hypothetical protein
VRPHPALSPVFRASHIVLQSVADSQKLYSIATAIFASSDVVLLSGGEPEGRTVQEDEHHLDARYCFEYTVVEQADQQNLGDVGST